MRSFYDACMNAENNALAVGFIEFRVRYNECDPMNVAHHTIYPVWFEMGRTELLRSCGINYRDLEAQGYMLAVASISIRYKKPARYDDVLKLQTRLVNVTRAKIEHDYALYRDGLLLATAQTTIACIDRAGKLQPVPSILVDALASSSRDT